MTDVTPQALFTSKYHNQEKMWSGHSFVTYEDLKALLAELPVSSEPIPARTYSKRYCGNLDQVFGELFFNLAAFEAILQDRAFRLKECYLMPFIRDNNFVVEFVINYQTKQGEEKSRSFEVLRLDQRNFCLFYDKFTNSHPIL